MKREQPFEVQVPTVHDVNGSRLWKQEIEGMHIVQFPIGNMDKTGNGSTQIQQGMQFDRRFGAAKRGPRKQRQTQVDGGGVESIYGIRQVQPQVFGLVQNAGLRDQALSEVGVDAPVSALVGLGQCGPFDRRTKTHVVQLGGLRGQTDLDIAQTFAIGQLGKRQDPKVFGARQCPHPVIAVVTRDESSKGGPWQTIHQLCKQGLADIHGASSNNYRGEACMDVILSSSRHRYVLRKR